MRRLALALVVVLATWVALVSLASAQPKPEFKLGFKALADQIPGVVGEPLVDEHYGPNGDSLQQTAKGLMVWRKADNWTAFTNGFRTWINGPFGVQERSNEEKFDWEAPATEPTPTPATKVDFPAQGKVLALVVPWAAGGSTDAGARLLAAEMERGLGVPVTVFNKPGGGSQVGLTELTRAKPDGYTLGMVSLPAATAIYLNPDTKAIFARKDFQPVAMHVFDPGAIAVAAGSRYRTVKELVDAAKANPVRFRAGTAGQLSDGHLALLQMESVAGVKFAVEHFDGAAPVMTALLGGRIDVAFGTASSLVGQVRTGYVRVLGVSDREVSKLLPGVSTLPSQGYDVTMTTARILSAPAGVPKEIVDVLSGAVKRAVESSEHRTKMEEAGLMPRYMDAAQAEAYWADLEDTVRPLIELARR